MNIRQIKDALKNRKKIWEGLRNKIWKQEHIEIIAEERLSICRANMCNHYDRYGTSEKAVFKGEESCAACGCRLDLKTRSLSSNCGLEELQMTPLWTALVSEQDADMIKNQIEKNEV